MIDEAHIKLECLRLAAGNCGTSTSTDLIVKRARGYSEFVLGDQVETPSNARERAVAKLLK